MLTDIFRRSTHSLQIYASIVETAISWSTTTSHHISSLFANNPIILLSLVPSFWQQR